MLAASDMMRAFFRDIVRGEDSEEGDVGAYLFTEVLLMLRDSVARK